nr:primosomal protein DnaI [Salsuginibacillus kocurii]
MDSIQSAMRDFMNSEQFEERFAQAQTRIFNNERVKAFLSSHPELSEDVITQDVMKLYEYKKEWENCDQCPGLSQCPNLMQGYQPELYVERGRIYTRYNPCFLKVEDNEFKRRKHLIKSYYIPNEILNATFSDLHIDTEDEERSKIAQQALEFAHEALPGEDGSGLYIHGSFGVGKTFIAGAVANVLAERGVKTIMMYAPDFFREMKQAIAEGTVQEKLEEVQQAEVLIMDDIGAETMSGWIRDDVLGVILQQRMMEKLPTIYTSNFDYDELENHMAYSHKGGEERVKAQRIMERIRPFTSPLYLTGKNRRHN